MTHPDLPLTYLARRPPAGEGAPPLVVLLHGYGSNEHDLFDLAEYLDPQALVLSARAPIFLGPGAFAWFEIAFTREGIAVDEAQARRSAELVADFIARAAEAFGADPARVALVGFSQGAMLAAVVALGRPELVAATAVLSGIVPSGVLEGWPDGGALAGRRFLVAHGTQDAVVPVEHGRATRALLEQLPVQLRYAEYPMGHGISPESLRDLVGWLSESVG